MSTQRPAFTRAELLAVIVAILVMGGLAIPWIYQMRGTSRRTFCESRMIMVAKGLFLKGIDSPGFPGYREPQAVSANQTIVETSWVFPSLPYIHPLGSDLAEEIKLKKAPELSNSENVDLFRLGPYADLQSDHGQSGEQAGKPITIFLPELVCPASQKTPTDNLPQPLSFVANCGMPDVNSGKGPRDHLANGVFFDRVRGSNRMSIDYLFEHDGLENTYLLSENLNAGQVFDTTESLVGFVWVDSFIDQQAILDPDILLPINQGIDGLPSIRTARPSSLHVGGVNMAFCDGSTTFVSEKIDYLTFAQFMTSAGDLIEVAGTDLPVKPPYRIIRE